MRKRGRLHPSTLRYFIPAWFILGVCVIPHGVSFVAWDEWDNAVTAMPAAAPASRVVAHACQTPYPASRKPIASSTSISRAPS